MHAASCSVGCVQNLSGRAATVNGVETAEATARRTGIGVIELLELTRRLDRASHAAFHEDGVHFRCSVYREIDLLLLGLIAC